MLVDPTPEDFSAGLAQIGVSLGNPVPPPAAEPNAEIRSFDQMRQARATGALRPIPLIVLSHGLADDPSERPPGWPMDREERLWHDLDAAIARLVPGGLFVIAEHSRHNIHQEQPDIVISSIDRVVDAVRTPGIWATPPAGTPAA